ncbi:NAD-dependent epimerase/dehydratase family protein [Rheinheimera sp.]|uniref:NAD-dependent epimerase/dehydratase family protein n=1 Tax=Rheinheimera sp. TaxID=1869214 RepID=UPI003AF7A8A3
MQKTMLVTGATGFTGRWIARQGKQLGIRLVGTSFSKAVPDADYPELYACDLTDKSSIEAVLAQVKPDYVLHLAAISFVAHGSVQDIYQTNLVGTVNLLDAIKTTCPAVQKVLVASSGNVYGNSAELPITERTQLSPVNDYAVSKVAMEYACRSRMADLPIIITRPFNYTGIGQAEHFLLPKIVAAFKRQQTVLELGNLDVARDFTDVRDLATAYLKLVESNVDSEEFNLCSGKPVNLMQVIEMMQRITGFKLGVQVNPAFVRSNEVKQLYGSEDKLRAVIGDYRHYTDLEDTLAWMYSSK